MMLACFLFGFTNGDGNAMQVSFKHKLANFNGIAHSQWARLTVDKERGEIYTLNQQERKVYIYNEYAMEIYDFGADVDLSGAADIALGDDGVIFVLFTTSLKKPVLELDYKGQPIRSFQFQQVPSEFASFRPDRLDFKDGRLYVADSGSLRIMVTDTQGIFQQGYQVAELLEKAAEAAGRDIEKKNEQDKRREPANMSGFCVDDNGNMFFTVPVMFAAFKLSPAGKLVMFGKSGSAEGKFGVVAGIDTDAEGHIYVADRLRSVVMAFDENFNYITEFGYRGGRPGSLTVPDDVVIDDRNQNIYVSQAANRGVSVFGVLY